LSQVHQQSRNAPFNLLVQQRLLHPLEIAPFALLVQQRLLHPLEICTVYQIFKTQTHIYIK